MEGLGWFMTIVIGGIAGFIAEKIMKADMGLIANIVVGILGAVLLNALLSALGVITEGGKLVQCIVAVIGACILIALYRMIKGRKD